MAGFFFGRRSQLLVKQGAILGIMNTPLSNLPIRENNPEWMTIVSGDNDVEIIECKIEVDNFAHAAEVAAKMAPIVMQYETYDSEYALRVTLARYGVEARLTVPAGHWESESQRKLTEGIAELKRQVTA